MIYEVKPVASRKDLNTFISLPLQLYKANEHYVFPLRMLQDKLLDRKHNPFYRHATTQLFLLYRKSRPVGRIAAVINDDHLSRYHDETGFFGLYECINNVKASALLFRSAENWLKEKGMKRIAGPENLSTNEEVGFLTSGYDKKPVFLLPYNPSWYVRQAENYGFTKLMDLFSYRFLNNENLFQKVGKVDHVRRRLESRGILIRPINLSRFEEEVLGLQKIYNASFDENWGFLPLSDREFLDYARNLRLITPRELMLVAEKEGRIIGFICNVPDINQVLSKIKNGRLFPFGIFYWLLRKRWIDQVRILILGVDKEYRNQGVDLCLYGMLFQNGSRMGIMRAEAAYVMENNAGMIRILESLGAERIKSYRLFEKEII